MQDMTLPKEGDLYKTYIVDNHTFEIRYGFYDARERGRVEPLPVFPDLVKDPVYTTTGEPVTSLVQVPCEHYIPKKPELAEGWCFDCCHYGGGRNEMGRCLCPRRRRE